MLTRHPNDNAQPDQPAPGVGVGVVAPTRAGEEEELLEEAFVVPWQREWPRPWMSLFLEAMSVLPDITASARASGVSRQTVLKWRNRIPEFDEAVSEARQHERDQFERNVRRWASTGLPIVETRTEKEFDDQGRVVREKTVTTERAVRSERLAEVWLRAHYGDKYKPVSRKEIVGDDEGGPIRIAHIDQIDAQVALLRKELEQRARAQGSPAPPDEKLRDQEIAEDAPA